VKPLSAERSENGTDNIVVLQLHHFTSELVLYTLLKEFCPLGYNSVYYRESQQIHCRNVSPPFPSSSLQAKEETNMKQKTSP
jgi:hypothetical protein